jgi:spore coat protein U-like protein
MPIPLFFQLWKLSLLALLFVATQQAFAACAPTAGTTPAIFDYGTSASQNVPNGGISPNASGASGSFRVTCSIGLTLQLLSTTSWLRYTAQNALQLSNGTDTIPYTIASNSTYNPAITAVGGSVGGVAGFNLLTLALLVSGSFDIPLHVKTLPTTTWPSAGTYTGTQILAVDGSICTGIGLPGVCIGSSPVSANVTFTMKLVVSKSCEFISTPTLVDFGIVSFVSNATNVQLSASLRCTNQEDYLLYVDNGNNYSAGSRRMKSPAGNTIAYEILKPLTTLPLGILTPLSRLGTGTSESVIFPMRVTTGQTTPPAGVYKDNVRVVIEY